jgi:predicted transposase YbfD/YdcC
LRVAPTLLRAVPLSGRVVTGDARSCQQALCRQMRQAAGPFLFAVTATQPDRATEVALLVDQPPPGAVLGVAHSHGHPGSRHERRTLWASSVLTASRAEAGWPQIQQVLRGERLATEQDVCTRAGRDLVTSLETRRSASAWLALVRGHWRSENHLHYVRAVTFGEEASTLRSGAAPRVMAALRTTVLGLLHRHRWRNMAAARRHDAWRPAAHVLRLLGITVP